MCSKSMFRFTRRRRVVGLIGSFEAQLYGSHILSNRPDDGLATPGLREWDCILFPLQDMSAAVSEMQVVFERHTHRSTGDVWYEWRVGAAGHQHNRNGRAWKIHSGLPNEDTRA